MSIKILYILPSFNKFGGTPKKTLDLIKYSSNECYLYVWTNAYAKEFKDDFTQSGAEIFVGDYKRNIFKHISTLLKIVDENNIEIIQSQFFFGELLAGILKKLRPEVKLIIAFVGSISPSGYRQKLLNILYNKIDAFVFISKYVKTEKIKIYPKIKHKKGLIIYNGTNRPHGIKHDFQNQKQGIINILCVSGLSKIKNVQVLIDCMVILLEKNYTNIQFLIAGDGPEKESLNKQILDKHLSKNVKLLGYQKNIGDLYNKTNIFAHPCYVEGFGIAVAEAMIAEKPIVVSNAGALPELIKNNETGLLVNPFDAQEWADAIIKLIENPDLARKLAKNAKLYAETEFSVERFVEDYTKLYKNLIN